MPDDMPANRTKPVALLEPDELERYRRILAYVEHQATLVQRARLAAEEAEFVAVAVEKERARCWRALCETHGLDADARYDVDPSPHGKYVERAIEPGSETLIGTAAYWDGQWGHGEDEDGTNAPPRDNEPPNGDYYGAFLVLDGTRLEDASVAFRKPA
jgi:hypothetical protein